MGVFKKIVKSKDFIWLLVIQVVLFSGLFLFVIFTTRQVNLTETKEIRLYSPSVSIESDNGIGAHDDKVIKINSTECEFICSGRAKVNMKESTVQSFYEQLQMEDYLDLTYVEYSGTNEIVALRGEGHIYYTLEDYNNYNKSNLIAGIIIISCLDLLYLLFSVCWILECVLGISTKIPLLRKRNPIEKHIYTDEENEFSPYKQKLLDKDREEETNSD